LARQYPNLNQQEDGDPTIYAHNRNGYVHDQLMWKICRQSLAF
jgi:hypothetical protein